MNFAVESILAKGIDEKTGEYDIPDTSTKSKVAEQLEILKTRQRVVKAKDDDPPSKIQKLDKDQNSDQKLKPIPSSRLSSSQDKPRSSPSPSSRISSEEIVKKSPVLFKPSFKQASSPGPSSLQKKHDEKEFFKERAEVFKAKNPDKLRAPSPAAVSNSPRSSQTSSQRSFNPTKEEQLEEVKHHFLPVILPKGQMADKLKEAAPYNFFLTTVTAAPETHSDPLSVTFQELLDPSLGELESSVQFNFMVDVGWLLAQYAFAKYSSLPMLILFGQDMPGLSDINKKRPNITSIKVNIPTPFGCHHTKMMILFYKDSSLRVIVSTANLYEDDWENRVQGLWISDKLPALPEGVSHTAHGESETGFRGDLMRYLIQYNITKLQPIIARIRESDFSSVNVFFVASVPGSHRDSGKGIYFGHQRLGTLLSENSAPVDDSSPIWLQCSSIGSLGSSASAYLTGEIATSFKKDSAPVGLRRLPSMKLIYPSLNNVISSHDGMAGGGCLPYDGKVHDKQRWLSDHLYQWKASSRNRNQAMPHIKSYCRFSDRGLYWFVLTSANLSRAAWGIMNKSNKTLNPTLRINSYEAGVAFFPRVILGKDRFPMNMLQRKDDSPIFRLPFDTPPVPYGKDDVPYCAEYLKAYLAKYGAL